MTHYLYKLSHVDIQTSVIETINADMQETQRADTWSDR